MQGKLIYEFGRFRLDPQERQLLCDGQSVSLSPQLFSLLLVFVQNPGHLLSKEYLRNEVWGKAYVSEDALKVIVGNLRKALASGGNGANGEHYIENVRGGGYRFKAAVSKLEITDEPEATTGDSSESTESARDIDSASPQPKKKPTFRQGLVLTGCVLAVGIASALVAAGLSRPVRPLVAAYKQLTHQGHEVYAVLPTDGVHLYFQETSMGRQFIGVVPLSGNGEPVHLSIPFKTPFLEGVFPRGEGLLIADGWPQGTLWKLPLPSGSPQPLGKLDGGVALSADGHHFARVEDGHALVIAEVENGVSHRIYSSAQSQIFSPNWSPDGRRLCFTQLDPEAGKGADLFSIWSIDTAGAKLTNVVPPSADVTSAYFCSWTPDASYLLYSAISDGKSQIWAMKDKAGWLVLAHPKPTQLTNGPIEFYAPSASLDGQKIFAMGRQRRGELVRYDQHTRAWLPLLDGLSADSVDISRDGEWVAYVKFPESTLWRSRIDGSDPLQLTFAPVIADSPHWAPDGKRIAYRARSGATPLEIFLIGKDGGFPQQLIPADEEEEGVPTWSPDGRLITFGRLRYQPEKIDVSIFDLQTGKVETVPGSQGLWSPRWSPRGGYLLSTVANPISFDSKGLCVFDFRTKKWKKLLDVLIEEAVWSHDDKWIYFVAAASPERVLFRIRVKDGKLERTVNLTGFPYLNTWLGLAPDDSPLLMREMRETEIYDLDVKW